MNSDAEKNIVNVAMEFLPFYTGHGIYLLKLHRYLERLGFHFTVITPRQLASIPSAEVMEGIQVHRLEAYEKARFLRFYLAAVVYLIKHRKSYQIVHAHSFHDRFLLMLIVLKLLRKKFVSQMALLGTDDPENFLKVYSFSRFRFYFITRWTDVFRPISTPIEQTCIDAGIEARKIKKIYQGVDIQKFIPVASAEEKRAARAALGLPQQRLAIFVGGIIDRKGVKELLTAWIDVQAQVKDATLVLVGPYDFGAENENMVTLNQYVDGLRKLVELNSLQVVWVGKTDKVEDYMRVADVFVFPSKKEGFGNVIIEAMACELPCIVTPMDGVANDTVIDAETGFIVEGHQALVDKTVQLLTDTELSHRMGVRGREVALQKFAFEKIAPQYTALYQELIHQKG